ncbi:MAG: osmotically inducible protein OsmC, partial [Candidatus Marinimicrobia bacterium]|nr:osmotically inducible protein OsmC [Candidatus Neomarinimicrobiota bacterium]
MDMKITFPGGKKINAEYNGQIIKTDQAVASGGNGSAPEPFDLFLASIGTCAGIYVLGFCQQRFEDAAK